MECGHTTHTGYWDVPQKWTATVRPFSGNLVQSLTLGEQADKSHGGDEHH
jgi:hypothetical protein